MKNWLRKNMFALCSASLAYSFIYYIQTRSHFLFGEPEFPTED